MAIAYLILAILPLLLISPTHSLKCTSQNFTSNSPFFKCLDLPYLNAYLHYTYDSSKSTLSIAFTAPPARTDGWIAWAINPTGTGMVGAQTLAAFKLPNGTMTVNTYNISSYGPITESEIKYEVRDKRAEYVNGVMRLFATVAVPEGEETVNQVWQVGGVVEKGVPMKHEFGKENLKAFGLLDLMKGVVKNSPASSPAKAPEIGGSPPAKTTAPAPSAAPRMIGAGFFLFVLLQVFCYCKI